jgi:SseB protein N-terminal domain
MPGMSEQGGTSGRSIPDPGFAGDLGEADPALRSALAGRAADPADSGGHLRVLDALTRARLLVPVVALLGEVEYDEAGRAREKTTDMAAVLLTGRDGRQALLAFSGLDSLTAWRADARPVPVTAADAARSAVQEQAAALLLDVAGPAPYAVEGVALDRLARGWTIVQTGLGPAWVEPGDAPSSSAEE